LLNERGIEFEYREYRKDPLSAAEIRRVLKMLGMGPKDVLRKNDAAFKQLGLTGRESDATLVKHMAAHPTLLQRPIGVAGNRAVVGRPAERLLELAGR
jgi:arsenate reductase